MDNGAPAGEPGRRPASENSVVPAARRRAYDLLDNGTTLPQGLLLHKAIIVLITLLDFTYNLAFYLFGERFTWWTTVAYFSASTANLLYFRSKGNFRLFRNIQTTLTIALPLVAQVAHGGFSGGSGVVLAASYEAKRFGVSGGMSGGAPGAGRSAGAVSVASIFVLLWERGWAFLSASELRTAVAGQDAEAVVERIAALIERSTERARAKTGGFESPAAQERSRWA